MLSRVCTTCLAEKDLDQFVKSKLGKFGKSSQCKSCDKVYRDARKDTSCVYFKNRYANNREEILARRRNKYHSDEQFRKNILTKAAEWRAQNPCKVKENKKKEYQKNREKIIKRSAQWLKDNPIRAKKTKALSYEKNAASIKEKSKIYRDSNPEKVRKAVRSANKKRMEIDPVFRLEQKLRGRLRAALKGKSKSKNTLELVGCTGAFAMDYLNAQLCSLPPNKFTGEIATESSYGIEGVHIDHIRPCASFDLGDAEQQRICFHYTNLRPLWWYDNLSRPKKWKPE